MTDNSIQNFSKGERLLPYASLFQTDHESQQLPIFVNRVHESFDLVMHAHDFIEICMVTEGTGFHYIGDDQMPVSRGDLFFIPVGISHVFRPSSTAKGRSLIMYNCIFTTGQLDKLLQAVYADPQISDLLSELNKAGQWLHVRDRNEEGQQLFHKLHDEFTSRKPGFTANLCATTIELLIMVYRRWLEKSQPQTMQQQQPTPSASASMQQIVEQIDANCTAELHVADMAAQLGISERHFQRGFKKATGMTFLDYVQSARIDLSCKLLLRTDARISEIAVQVGYQDMKFFNELFKKKTGVTPRQYRLSPK
ncbi:AraC family transcriptional regulator [Paenibacillus lignilyticus]|uniref:Helix-turn-helix domain-containing protein n=1 Tax=Paenibacillus lignilyticus TaxID=1172615 RepID=A0ABS5CKD4_9BACL|nr:helix-turn-helix domain-containing protein [Paenibacillus lignilyticus]MBP3966319.1 helix-turn-helix domain-containing protein [Paenibacillus lignilyticus]